MDLKVTVALTYGRTYVVQRLTFEKRHSLIYEISLVIFNSYF